MATTETIRKENFQSEPVLSGIVTCTVASNLKKTNSSTLDDNVSVPNLMVTFNVYENNTYKEQISQMTFQSWKGVR